MSPLALSLAATAMAVSGFVFGQWVVGRGASSRRWVDADGVPTLEHPARARSGGPCRCEVPYDQYSDGYCSRCHGKIPAPEIMACRCEVPYDRMLNGICSRCMGVIPASLDRSAEWLTDSDRARAEWLTDGERGRVASPSWGFRPAAEWFTRTTTEEGRPVEPRPTEGEWDAWKTPGENTFTVNWVVDAGVEGFQRTAFQRGLIVETRQAAEALVALLNVFGAVPDR